jgi:hypothetical protein
MFFDSIIVFFQFLFILGAHFFSFLLYFVCWGYALYLLHQLKPFLNKREVSPDMVRIAKKAVKYRKITYIAFFGLLIVFMFGWVVIWFTNNDVWIKFIAMITCIMIMFCLMLNMYFYVQSQTYTMALKDLTKGTRRPWGHLFEIL